MPATKLSLPTRDTLDHRIANQQLGKLAFSLASGLAAGWALKAAYKRVALPAPAAAAPDTTGLPVASTTDTITFFLDVMLPNLAKGLLLRRPKVVAMAEALDLDRRAVRRMQALRERYWPGPLLLRMPMRNQAILLSPQHVRRVLNDTPEPFAAASSEKQAALAHFQPRSVLASNEPERAERRRINEEALDAHQRVHAMADNFVPVVRQETAGLLAQLRRGEELRWDDFIPAWYAMVRQVVFGAGARDDHALTDMLAQLRSDANWAFLMPKRKRLQQRFFSRLKEHLARAEAGSLAARMAQMRGGRDDMAQQVPQWLFAFDAAGMATFRALALLAAHPGYMALAREEIRAQADDGRKELPLLRATLMESTRLWPTTPVILRQTTRDTAWETSHGSGTLPARTGVLIYAPFFHRDSQRLAYADRFSPQLWLGRQAHGDAALVPFSDGPAFCPGRELVLLLGSLMLAELIEAGNLRQQAPGRLDASKPLPGTLNNFSLRFSLQG